MTRAQRRDELLARLMDAVERLLAQGVTYSELSVERLVKETGTSRSRFYVYFEDKSDLLRALTEDMIAALFDVTLQWWSMPADATEGDLRRVTERIFSVYLPHARIMAAVVQVATHDSALRELFARLFDDAVLRYAERIAAGQREGTVDAGLDPYRTAAVLSWMTESGLYQLVAPRGTRDAGRLIDALTKIVWNTLYAPRRDALADA